MIYQKNSKAISFLLRVGIAISFLYASISSFLNPTNWIGFVPNFLTLIIDAKLFLILFSVYELILALLLLSNYKIFYLAILSSLTIFFIILFNTRSMDIVFRDIAILLMAIALIFLSREKE